MGGVHVIHFVTGIQASGKTTLARSLSGEYISFDALWSYGKLPNATTFLESLPDGCVIDAVPWSAGDDYAEFRAWRKGRVVRVTCCTLPREEWLKRMRKRGLGGLTEERHRGDFRRFYVASAPLMGGIDEWHGGAPDFAGLIREHVEKAPSSHDAKYQDIEEIGFVGYSGSAQSWEDIRALVDWGGATIVDLGCNHGFFCFRAEDAGASVTGLDESRAILDVAHAVNLMRGGGVTFKQWNAGEPVPAADVTLCLNALHHFSDSRTVLDGIRSSSAIFEANDAQGALLRDAFDEVAEHPSHRKGRHVYECRRAACA